MDAITDLVYPIKTMCQSKVERSLANIRRVKPVIALCLKDVTMEPNIWYKQTGQNILDGLTTSKEGLSTDEATRRLFRNGPNELKKSEKTPSYQILFSQFKTFPFWILIAASLTSALLGVWILSVLIFSIAIIDLGICFTQDLKAKRSTEQIEKLNAKRALVYRDGKITSVPAARIVTGDVIELIKGDAIAADARIIESSALKCLEFAVTGETGSVEKNSAHLEEDGVPIRRRENMVYMGSHVANGTALAVVVTTATNTEIGRRLKPAHKHTSPIQEGILVTLTVFVRMMLLISLLFVIGMMFFK